MSRTFVVLWWVLIGMACSSQEVHAGTTTLDIVVPRAHNPVFVEPEGVFHVEVRALPRLTASGWRATLQNDLASWRCQVEEAVQGDIFLGTELGWTLAIRAPAGVSPELMELVLEHESGALSVSSRAVSVVPDFESDFYIIHQSDQHLTLEKAVEPGGKASKKWGNGSMEALAWVGPILNVVNPRFVLHTGDNMQIYHEPDYWCGLEEGIRRIGRFLNGLSGYQVPTVATTGNHDIGYTSYVDIEQWREAYHHYMGQRAFSFRMGSFYVFANEWTDTAFTERLRDDYRQSWSDPSVKYRLVATHYYDGPQANTSIAAENYPSDLTLVGHIHRTRVVQEEPYRVLSVGAAQQHQRAAFFDFRRTDDGWECHQAKVHAEGINVHPLVGDWGEPTVSIAFEKENDGKASSNIALVSNKLPHNFYDGRIRFLMEKGEYHVDGGIVLATYDADSASKTAVLVKVDIAQSGDTRVSISKK